MVQWEQSAAMAACTMEDIQPYLGFIKDQIKIYSEEDQERIRENIRENYKKFLNAKQALRLFNLLYIVKKIAGK